MTNKLGQDIFEIPAVFSDEIHYFNRMADIFKYRIAPTKLPTLQIAICDYREGNEKCEGVNNSYTALIDTGAFQNFIWDGIVKQLNLKPFRIDPLNREWYRCAIRITDTWLTGVEFAVNDRLDETHQLLLGCQFLAQWNCIFEYNAAQGEWTLTI